MAKRFSVLALAAMLAAAPVLAEESDFKVAFEGLRMFNGFIPSGLDLSLTYTGMSMSDLAGTSLFLKAGGGYENTALLRDPATGDPWTGDAAGNKYDMLNFQWELAFIQGLARRGDGDNSLEVFAFYRGRFDSYKNELSDSVFADIRGLLGTSFMAGLSYDTRELDRHRSKKGIYAEASAEWGPGFVNANSDFWRVSGQLRGFLPVFDIATDGGNLFNVYLAGFAGADYAAGASVPIYVQQSFGGRDLRDSLGNSVRGYGNYKFDSAFKSVANAELRLIGPAIVLYNIVPCLYGFADAGYYSGFAESANRADASGFLVSTGGGVALDLFSFVQLGVMAGVRLVDDSIGYRYSPENFFWGIKIFLHF